MHERPSSLHETLRLAGGEARLLAVGRYAARKGQHYPAHFHRALEVLVFQTGRIECVIAGRPPPDRAAPEADGESVVVPLPDREGQQVVRTEPGLVLVIPPRTVHADVALTAYSHHYLLVELPPGVPAPGRVLTFSDDADHSLGGLLGNLVREWQRQQPDRAAMLQLMLAQLGLLAGRLERSERHSGAEGLVSRAERLLEATFTREFRIAELAAQLHVSKSALRSHFVRLRGYSPKTYQQRLRLQRALELIASSSLPLENVAALSGFDSASHLSRQVKAATGTTPGRFRNNQ